MPWRDTIVLVVCVRACACVENSNISIIIEHCLNTFIWNMFSISRHIVHQIRWYALQCIKHLRQEYKCNQTFEWCDWMNECIVLCGAKVAHRNMTESKNFDQTYLNSIFFSFSCIYVHNPHKHSHRINIPKRERERENKNFDKKYCIFPLDAHK